MSGKKLFTVRFLQSCLKATYTFSTLYTQRALQTHTSAHQLTFGAKWTTTTNTLHPPPTVTHAAITIAYALSL